MPDPARAHGEQTNIEALLAVAECATALASSRIADLEAARECLMAALARGFEALRDPECAALIGPIVPGALMPGGARVPGTSLELEPAQAAFCLGLMLCRPAEGERSPQGHAAQPAAVLAAVLATADYQARKAAMEGKTPPKVRDVLAAMLKTSRIQETLAGFAQTDGASHIEPTRRARVAVSATVIAQFGGTPTQAIRAISYACLDGDMSGIAGERHDRCRHWAMADAMSRGVRHACQAMAAGRPAVLTSAELEVAQLACGLLGVRPGRSANGLADSGRERLESRRKTETLEAAPGAARLRAAVDRHFCARQAERIKGLFSEPHRLDDLPVSELLAALVTNGAH